MEVWMMVGVWAQDIPEKKMILQKGAPADSPASKNLPRTFPHIIFGAYLGWFQPTHLKNMIVKLDHFPKDRGENKQ